MKKLSKKIPLFLLSFCLVMPFAACGSAPGPANTVFSIDDLPGKKIGVQLGTTGDIFASKYESDGTATLERFNKGTDAVQALKQGKIDCVLIDGEPAKAFVEKNSDLTILEEEFAIEEYAICISKDNSELKDQINAALSELKADGTLQSIIDNYIGDDTKGKSPYVIADMERPNGTLVMATNAAFEPYEYQSDGKVVGIDADIAQAICDKLGMELKIEDMEFDSIINAVQSGKASIGLAGMTVTEDRLQNIDFTDPYTTSTQVIIVRK